MGNSPSREAVGFGIELELTGIPRNVDVPPWKKWDYKRDDGKFFKYPDNYEQWNLQQDSSIEPRDESTAISIEAVSRPFFVPVKDWIREIVLFWAAFGMAFEQEFSNETCGSHIHVKPGRQSYDMEGLRKIAYAVVVYEKHVLEFLPEGRRNNHYCQPNTQVSPSLKRIFSHGRSRSSYNDLRDHIYTIDTSEELCTFIQGDQEGNRRVLWNFNNVSSGGIGTIEFRGGPGVYTARQTISWILFAVGFILLAIEEDKLGVGNFSYVDPESQLFQQRAGELWSRICNCTQRKITQKVPLPRSYQTMHEHGSSSGATSDSEIDYPEVDDLEADDSEAENSEADDPDAENSEAENLEADDSETENSEADDSETENSEADDPEADDPDSDDSEIDDSA